MKKLYKVIYISIFSIFILSLASCGKGNNDLRKMDTFDVVMSIFFVILLAIVVGVIIYFIVKHLRRYK